MTHSIAIALQLDSCFYDDNASLCFYLSDFYKLFNIIVVMILKVIIVKSVNTSRYYQLDRICRTYNEILLCVCLISRI